MDLWGGAHQAEGTERAKGPGRWGCEWPVQRTGNGPEQLVERVAVSLFHGLPPPLLPHYVPDPLNGDSHLCEANSDDLTLLLKTLQSLLITQDISCKFTLASKPHMAWAPPLHGRPSFPPLPHAPVTRQPGWLASPFSHTPGLLLGSVGRAALLAGRQSRPRVYDGPPPSPPGHTHVTSSRQGRKPCSVDGGKRPGPRHMPAGPPHSLPSPLAGWTLSRGHGPAGQREPWCRHHHTAGRLPMSVICVGSGRKQRPTVAGKGADLCD